MNILVTGSHGQLGTEMRRVAVHCPQHRFTFTDAAELDITDAAAVQQAAAGMDAIVNCAAYTNVDKAEDDLDTARRVNATAAGNLATAAKANGTLLIHVSTDYVFGGQGNTPYTETDATNPLGAYGLTKWEGEQAIAAAGCRAIIIRTAWLYSLHGKNFVKTMRTLMASRKELNVVCDQTGTPTYAGDLADAIAAILNSNPADNQLGIYHYTNEGVCSWYDFAIAIRELSGLSNCHINPCRSSEFPSKVTRPAYSVLDKSRIRSTFGLSIPYWRESLKRCIAAMETPQTIAP